jgi:hypothetical protein
MPHLLESSDIWTLEEIFGKRAYLLSDRLKQTWYDLQKKDTFFTMLGVKHRRTIFKGPSVKIDESTILPTTETKEEVIGADLTEMQKQAEDDFHQLQARYARVSGFKP